MALGLFALGVSSHYVKGTNALFLGYSAASTMPYAIDDPREKGKAKTDQLDISELIVDVFNGSSSANMNTGIQSPPALIIDNFTVDEAPRYEHDHAEFTTC